MSKIKKGKIMRFSTGWKVAYFNKDNDIQVISLHPADSKQIKEWGLVFDNIDARILENPNVNFKVIKINGKRHARIVYDE